MSGTRDETKSRGYVAYLAAKIILDNCEISFINAKKKAARQAKVLGDDVLPSDEEIAAHLQSHKEIFNSQDNTAQIRDLRVKSLDIMRQLSEFNIYLVGPLVEGILPNINRMDFHCYTDDVNTLEFFFINHKIDYHLKDKQMWIGTNPYKTPVYLVDYLSAVAAISVFPEKANRQKIKGSIKGQAFEKINVSKLRALLDDNIQVLGETD